jgi:hypothetical protein
LICCFHSFFLKPLSVTLPFAARFTGWGDTEPRAKCIKIPAKAKTVTVAKGQKGDAGAVFDLAPKSRLGVGPVSSKRWGDGGRKKGEEKQPSFHPFLILPGVCGKLPRTGQGIFPGSDNFPQSPANLGRRQSGWKSERCRGTERAVIFAVKRFAEIFNRSDDAGIEM